MYFSGLKVGEESGYDGAVVRLQMTKSAMLSKRLVGFWMTQRRLKSAFVRESGSNPLQANVARQALALCLNAFACPCVWVRESMFMRARVCVFACVQESEWERKRGYTYIYRRWPWASLRFYLAVKKEWEQRVRTRPKIWLSSSLFEMTFHLVQ